MAARDAADTIQPALRSLQRQSMGDWECLVVDDGSTDATAAQVESLARTDARVRLLGQEATGVVAARNLAAAQASAPYVAILDADDVAHRRRLELQLAQATQQGGGVVVCHARYFRQADVGPGLQRYQDWLRRQHDGEALRRARYIEMPYAHSALLVERRWGDEVGWYQDHGWPEDFDFSLRLAASEAPHGVVPRPLVGWRVRAGSLSRSDPRYSLEAFTRCRAAALRRDFLHPGEPWWLWGHGDTGKALRRALAAEGRQPEAIVEVDPRKIGQRPDGIEVLDARQWILQPRTEGRLVISVAGASARRQIREALAPTGLVEGEGFVFAA
jgi:glycosyltransferase involved in cell wall biosynthesis